MTHATAQKSKELGLKIRTHNMFHNHYCKHDDDLPCRWRIPLISILEQLPSDRNVLFRKTSDKKYVMSIDGLEQVDTLNIDPHDSALLLFIKINEK